MSFLTNPEWKFWLDLLTHNGGPVIFIIGVWFITRKRVTPQDIDDLKTSINEKLDEQEQSTTVRLEKHAGRLTRLETDVKHMPTQNDITGLNLRIDKVNGVLQRVDGRLGGINRAVDLMNEHLLNRSNGK